MISSLLPTTSSLTTKFDEASSSIDDLGSETDEILRTTIILLLRMLYAQTHSHLESMDQELELLRLAPLSPTSFPGSGAGQREDSRLGKGKGRAEQEQMWKVDLSAPGGLGGPDGKGPLLDQRGRVS